VGTVLEEYAAVAMQPCSHAVCKIGALYMLMEVVYKVKISGNYNEN
jgi:hypothetical protein